MDEPGRVALADQAHAEHRDLGAMRAAYYRGCREGGMPRWLAAWSLLRWQWECYGHEGAE